MWQVPHRIKLTHKWNLDDPFLKVIHDKNVFNLVLSHGWHWEHTFALYGQMALLFLREAAIQTL